MAKSSQTVQPEKELCEELPTIHDCPYDASADAESLMKAMKGYGIDECLISVLCCRTQKQRQEIATIAKAKYDKDLIKAIKSETSGNFKKVLVGLLIPRIDYLAKALHRAICAPGTTESIMIDIICAVSNNHELKSIQNTYQSLYQTSLKDDIVASTSGRFRNILVSLLDGHRDEDHFERFDDRAIQADALALRSADISCLGIDNMESDFTKIISKRSFHHLRQVFNAYQKMCGHSIETSIKNEFTGDAKKALKAIVTCVQNRAVYYAKRLRKAMKGPGTDDRTLVLIIVSRCEIDLQTIKLEYQRLFHKSLVKDVASDTSGAYRKALLAILGEEIDCL